MDPTEIKNKHKKNRMVVDNSDDDSFTGSDICENTENTEKTNSIDEQNSEFNKQCDLLLEKITKNYKEQRDDIRNLVKLHKKEMKAINKNKRNRKSKDKTGFTKPGIVPDKLADFIGIENGTEMSRTELTGLLCKEFNRRNLYHKKDRRIIIPDNDVKLLFNLSKEADKSNNPKDKNGLNFYNLQTHIAQCYNEFNSNNTGQISTSSKLIESTADLNTKNIEAGKRKITINKF